MDGAETLDTDLGRLLRSRDSAPVDVLSTPRTLPVLHDDPLRRREVGEPAADDRSRRFRLFLRADRNRESPYPGRLPDFRAVPSHQPAQALLLALDPPESPDGI